MLTLVTFPYIITLINYYTDIILFQVNVKEVFVCIPYQQSCYSLLEHVYVCFTVLLDHHPH